MLYGKTGIVALTNNALNDYSPQMYARKVVWLHNDGSDDEVMYYNGKETMQITNNTVYESYPQISSGGIVWQTDDGDDEIEIFPGPKF